MNKGTEAASIFVENYVGQTTAQPDVSKKVNAFVFVDVGAKSFHPYELFFNALESRYGQPIFSTKAFVLKIKLNLEKFDIWRKVVVPENINFEVLHKVIRECFDWGYNHLHGFVKFQDQKPLVSIVSDEDDMGDFPREEPVLLESKTPITEYLQNDEPLVYTYDFGDNWEHFIEVEDVISNFDKNYPVCIAGQGDRPPEDVGGEGGYIDFLEIMGNPQHEDYKSMKTWYESQYYRGFDIDKVNRCLKHLL